MGSRLAVSLLVVCLGSCGAVLWAQSANQHATTNPGQPGLLALQGSVANLAGKLQVKDITLTGSAERIAGADDDTGAVTFKAIPTAQRLEMVFSNGIQTETRTRISEAPSGAWTGPNGVSHNIAYHNLLTEPGVFPLFALSNMASTPNVLVTFLGPESHNDTTLLHLTVAQQLAGSDVETNLAQHLTEAHVYLDAETLLPMAYRFNTHPDDNALIDIPTEIRYSNYKSFDGTMIPLRIQKLVNNSLVLDLQFSTVLVNSGLSESSIL